MWHYVEAIAPEPIGVYLTDEGSFRLDLDPVTTLYSHRPRSPSVSVRKANC